MRHSLALVVLLLLGSCSRWDLGVEIPFVATWDGQPVSCESATPALTDLRFYINDPQLIDTDGNVHDLRYATEFEWQNDVVALIDLENGKGTCASGSSPRFDRLIGVTQAGEYRGLRFTIGVPFRLNHANPQSATTPLGDPDMYWQDRSGYRFLRAGVQTGEGEFRFDLGSAGCDGTAGHITGCRFPNRVDVFLPDFIPGKDAVVVDLAALFDGTDAAAYAALGIDSSTGEVSGTQRVFAVR